MLHGRRYRLRLMQHIHLIEEVTVGGNTVSSVELIACLHTKNVDNLPPGPYIVSSLFAIAVCIAPCTAPFAVSTMLMLLLRQDRRGRDRPRGPVGRPGLPPEPAGRRLAARPGPDGCPGPDGSARLDR